jgi:hypothetical protein
MGCRAICVTLAACGALAWGCSSATDDPGMDPVVPPPVQMMMPIGMGPVAGAGPAVPMMPGNTAVPMNPGGATAGVGGGMVPMPVAGGDAMMMGTAGMAGSGIPQAGSMATAGSGGSTMVPPAERKAPCLAKGSQVAVIGDSYIEYTNPLVPRLEQKATAEGALKQGDHYNNQAVPGSSLGVGLLLIQPQWTSAKRASMNDIKFVVMNGGGNDVLLYNPQCLGDGASQDAGCRMVADTATAVAKEIMMDMKATGVSDVVYFFYPHVPAGGKDLMDNYASPLAKKNCEEGSDATYRCHFVSLVEAFEGHPEFILADGIHPTSAGADAQATVIWDAMKKNCVAQASGCCMP